MKYEWMTDYFLSKKGAVRDFKEEWNAVRFMVGDKMFGLHGADKYGKPIITLKLQPDFGELLRRQYEDIIPGYYMNKTHWNSLYLEGSVPDDVLRDMIDKSYDLIFASLPKKVRDAILAG